jgi:diketogulonate reductase-like aldo/keto reductase
MRAADESLGVRTESWSPLARQQQLFAEAAVHDAATAHGVTPGQVVLRWHVQLGALPIPKSATPSRQRENLDLWSFELTQAEMDVITGLGRADGRWFGGDPNHHEES